MGPDGRSIGHRLSSGARDGIADVIAHQKRLDFVHGEAVPATGALCHRYPQIGDDIFGFAIGALAVEVDERALHPLNQSSTDASITFVWAEAACRLHDAKFPPRHSHRRCGPLLRRSLRES